VVAVALDTMVVSALLHPSRSHPGAEEYRRRVAGSPIVISFVVVTELRYGALQAWVGRASGSCVRAGSEPVRDRAA
jgi:predicted nucleic acid-binding protein